MFKIKYHGGKSITYKQAAKQAREETDAIRRQGVVDEKGEVTVEAKEFADPERV